MNIIKNKIKVALFPAFLLAFTFLIAGPLNLYMNNQENFWFDISSILFFFILIFLIVLCVIIAMIIILSKRAFEIGIATIWGIGIALWIQGSILKWNYGLMNGLSINWGAYAWRGIIDTSIWIMCVLGAIIIAIKKKQYISKIMMFTSILIVLMQSTELILNTLNIEHKPYIVSDEEKFVFSKNKNVVIFIVDTFRSDIFQKIIDEKSSYGSEFKDFTYFRGTMGGFPYTYPSVQLLLTGKYYDNSLPIKDFITNVQKENSLFKILRENNFSSHVYSFAQSNLFSIDSYDNKTNIVSKSEMIKMTKKMYKLTAFRYMPQVLKKYFVITSDEFAKKGENERSSVYDIGFYHDILNTDFTTDDSNGIFKVYHLHGLHNPIRINSDIEEIKEAGGIEALTQAGIAELKIIDQYIEKLKELNIYDNTMIIVTGDHGDYIDYTKKIDEIISNKDLTYVNGELDRSIDKNVILTANPILLVKRFNEIKDTLTISDVPSTLGDIPNTILSALGIESKLDGKDIFKLKTEEERERYFYSYVSPAEEEGKLTEMTEYVIQGFGWDYRSWKATGKVYTGTGVKEQELPQYKLGEPINFGKGQNAATYISGWAYDPDDNAQWVGNSMQLKLKLNKIPKQAVMEIDMEPMIVPPYSMLKTFEVYINNNLIGKREYRGAGNYKELFNIPPNMLDSKEIIMTLKCLDPFTPGNADINSDKRALGVLIKTLKLTDKVQKYELGNEIVFGQEGNSDQYIAQGFYRSDEDGQWMGQIGELYLELPKIQQDVKLKMNIIPFIAGDLISQQVIKIYINDEFVEEKIVKKMELNQVEFIIHSDKLLENKFNRIRIECPDAEVPMRIGYNQDTRLLSINIKKIIIER